MTEPHEPEAVPEGEAAPEEQPAAPVSWDAGQYSMRAQHQPVPLDAPEPEPDVAPETEPTAPSSPNGAWYPVSARPESEAEAPEEPEPATVPEEVGEERADRHEGPSEPEMSEVEPETAEESAEPEAAAEPEPEPVEEPDSTTVPEEVGEERADRHEGSSAPGMAEVEPEPVEEPDSSTVPEEVGEERADRHEGPSESEVVAEPEAAAEPEPEADENEEWTTPLPGPEFAPAALAATEQPSVPEEPTSASSPPADAIFRQPSPASPGPEPTMVQPISEEEQRLAAERAARRDARAAALAAPAPEPVAPPKPVVIHKRTNDRFWGSLGLFLLRIVLAGIFTIRGLGILTDIPAAQAEFAKTVLADYPPGPQVMAIVTGVGSLLIALSLLLGLLTRVAGLGIALIAGGALVLVYWGPWSPFVAGQPGFLGEYQLLLAAIGILLMFVGGGGWSLDRSFRAGRERDKRERAAEAE